MGYRDQCYFITVIFILLFSYAPLYQNFKLDFLNILFYAQFALFTIFSEYFFYVIILRGYIRVYILHIVLLSEHLFLEKYLYSMCYMF